MVHIVRLQRPVEAGERKLQDIRVRHVGLDAGLLAIQAKALRNKLQNVARLTQVEGRLALGLHLEHRHRKLGLVPGCATVRRGQRTELRHVIHLGQRHLGRSERKAHKLATTGDLRPVKQAVGGHGMG